LFLKLESIVSAALLFAALSAAQTAGNPQFNDAFDAALEAESYKDYDVAIEQLEKAAGIDPSRNVIWSHLGDIYYFRSSKRTGDAKQADLTKADLAYRNAIRLDPYNAPYHGHHAWILAKEKKLTEAQDEANKAASMDPAFAGKYYFDFGAALFTTGQDDAVLEAFQKSRAIGYIEANYQYGLALVNRMTMTPDGRIILAPGTVEAFLEYLRLAPDETNARNACDILGQFGAAPKPPC
jgi:tetratricopeptide (TPR) repeat protein